MLERGVGVSEFRDICRADVVNVPLDELFGLIEVFRTMGQVLSAFSCQPKYTDSDTSMHNAAGRLICSLAESFEMRADMAAERIMLLRPADQWERDERARATIQYRAAVGEDLSELAALTASFAAPEKH